MASTGKSKRKTRKPRGGKGGPPRAMASTRRAQRAERVVRTKETSRSADPMLGRVGPRPESPFGGLPVSEIAILLGLVALGVGVVSDKPVAMVVGALVCALGVLEFTVREHFSGYRSHTTLLAAVPAVVVEALVAVFVGVPSVRPLILLPMVPIFGLSFWLLRRTFAAARHARVARPPAP